ncbi:MAG: carbohydrate binding family 9 domain-containing protein [Gemmatimonadetes bacterium]|nr:carbohydrate binding family 9 domain-containing protein [Gemmatimonadota bacterium]
MTALPRLRITALFVVCAAAASPLPGQSGGSVHPTPPPEVRAAERTSTIVMDGRLDEELWSTVPAATDFTQRDPNEGQPATQRTEIRFLYDAEALYIGARMYDALGAQGVRTRLARRDQEIEGDHLEFIFDTFHDHTGRTVFRVNPSGVRYDAGQAASSADPSWDPVWEARAQIDSLGWTAELRIPFSQLRFARDGTQTWGLQIWRYVERLNEMSMWSFWRRDEAGGPSRFGHLEGLRIASRPLGVELLPYVVARASYLQPTQPGSPFHDPRAYHWRAGGDLKALLTSNLTLDATFNPDFGQVEVDPAVVNLSAFETFFPERRPFFVEGSGLFGFGSFSCFFCSNVSSISLFYSRRIGRRPQGNLPYRIEYIDVPENTTILGAAKVTGRTAGGQQVGILNALTRAEAADAITLDGRQITRELEPLTNYFVGRTRRNLRGGDVRLGAIGTSVIRSFGYDSLALQIPQHAEALGFDWDLAWRQKTYSLMGNFALSQVSGEPEAMHRLQLSSARYFQRPDRGHGSNRLFTDRYDPSLTSMRGYGGYMRLAKQAGNLLWETAVNYRSPGFEVNDLAFLTRADYLWMNGNVLRMWTRPTRHYRSADVIVGGQQQLNYDGDLTEQQLQAFGAMQFLNYWSASTFIMFQPEVYEDRLTRGGPVVRRARNWTWIANLSTDSRRQIVLATNPSYGRNAEGAYRYSANLDIRYKPASNVSLSLAPAFNRSSSTAQFVRSFEDPTATDFYGRRVVFADLAQHTLSMDTRLNVTFTPTLTLELFAQPFVSTGDYSNFKEFVRPRTLEKQVFGVDVGSVALDPAGRCSSPTTGAEVECIRIDPDGEGPATTLSFGDPNFNLRSLRGNAVLRWEYRPGSALFLVWQQQRSGSGPFGDFALSRDTGDLFRERPDNIFLIKATYWFGR